MIIIMINNIYNDSNIFVDEDDIDNNDGEACSWW